MLASRQLLFVVLILAMLLASSDATSEEIGTSINASLCADEFCCFSVEKERPEFMFRFAHIDGVYPMYSCGLIPAYDHGSEKYGFLDKHGKFIIPPIYDGAYSFRENRAVVVKKGEYAVIGVDGKLIVDFGKYAGIGNYYEDRAAVVDKNRHVGYIDKSGEEVIKCKYSEFVPSYVAPFFPRNHQAFTSPHFFQGYASVRKSNDRVVYIDVLGNELELPYEPCGAFTYGYAIVKIGHKYNYSDIKGNLLLSENLKFAKPFSDGLAYVVFPNNSKGYISIEGKLVISLGKNVKAGCSFSEGYASISVVGEESDGCYFIDKKGARIFGPFRRYGSFTGGYSPIAVTNALDCRGWTEGLLSNKGEVFFGVTPNASLQFSGSSTHQYFFPYCVETSEEIRIFHVSSAEIPFSNPSTLCLSTSASPKSISFTRQFDLAAFKDSKTEKWGYKNSSGKVMIDAKHDIAVDFTSDYAVVGLTKEGGERFDMTYRLISKDGSTKFESDKQIIYFAGSEFFLNFGGYFQAMKLDGTGIGKQQYRIVRPFSEGKAIVCRAYGDAMILIDKNLNRIGDEVFEDGRVFSEGLCVIKKNGKFGYINEKGKTCIPASFDEAFEFTQGYAVVKKRGRSFLIDTDGKRISSFFGSFGSITPPMKSRILSNLLEFYSFGVYDEIR